MGKLISFMHTSLDGFVAGTNGEMDWIHVDEEIFEYAGNRTNESDTALYGRVTYQMMDSYWPAAADQPGASKHDIEHSQWYNRVTKVVLSNTLQQQNLINVTVINDDAIGKIKKLKEETVRDIMIFGSPSVVHLLSAENLIDDYWLFVNPLLLGKGIPMFKNITEKIKLKLVTSNSFSSGVVCLHYEKAE